MKGRERNDGSEVEDDGRYFICIFYFLKLMNAFKFFLSLYKLKNNFIVTSLLSSKKVFYMHIFY